MKICLAGGGAFGKKHLAGLKNIDDVEVAALVGRVAESTEAMATEYGIPFWTLDLQEALAQPGIEAILPHALPSVSRSGRNNVWTVVAAGSASDSRE